MVELTKAFYSPTELANLLGVSADTIMNYIHQEQVFAIKLSERTYRIPQREVVRKLGQEVAPSKIVRNQRGGPAAAAKVRRRLREEHRQPALSR